MMQTTIYLIRHGESKGNREGLFRGRHDFPLTDVGKEQARSLEKELREIGFNAVYSSPLRRALATAQELCANRRIEPIVEDGFHNISLGEWEGRPKTEIAKRFPASFKLWRSNPEKLKMKGVETLAQVQKRAVKTLALLTEELAGGRFAVVTHRAVIKPLIAGILGIAEPYFWKLHPDTAAYSIIEHTQRGFALTLFNQTRHLKEFIREDV